MKSKIDIYLELCSKSLELYDGSISGGAFIENYFKKFKVKDPTICSKIAGIFYGCQNFKKILHNFVEGYSNKNTIRKTEYYYYIVLSYLVIVGVGVYDWAEVETILRSQPPLKMNRFLNYFLSEDNFNYHVDEWNCLYDAEFIKTNITNHINQISSKLATLNSSLIGSKVHVQDVKDKRVIRQVPFNLTKPKPPSILIPDLLTQPTWRTQDVIESLQQESEKVEPTEVKSKEVVKEKNISEPRKSDSQIASYRRRRRRPKLSLNISRVSVQTKKSVEVEELKRNKPEKLVSTKPAEIKPTKASVLREAQFYEKIRDSEIKKITDLAEGNGDSYEYDKYLKEEMSKMKEEEGEKRNRLHESVIEGRYKAIKSVEDRKMDKEEIGAQVKEETKRILDKINSNLMDKLDKTNDLKKEFEKLKDHVKESKEEIKARNRQQKLNDQLELEKRRKEYEREMEEEMDRKQKLIAEIRLQESLLCVKMNSTFHDLTETGNHGLLSEMSVVELKERLSLMREERKVMLIEKSNKLRDMKLSDKKMMEDKMQLINRYRQVIASTDKR